MALHIGNLGGISGSSRVCTDMTNVDDAAADIGGASTNPGRWAVFGKAMAIVLLWQLIPIADVAVGMVVVARESPAHCGVDRCGWYGLILVVHLGVVAVLLVLSTILVAILSAARRRGSSPRSALLVGFIGAVPAMATLLLTVPGLIEWANVLLKY